MGRLGVLRLSLVAVLCHYTVLAFAAVSTDAPGVAENSGFCSDLDGPWDAEQTRAQLDDADRAASVPGVFNSGVFYQVDPDKPVVHDAEHYLLHAQHRREWAEQDSRIDQLLAKLRKKHGRPPNIIHILLDDLPFGAIGVPAMQPMRGYTTPRLNTMAAEGMLFTRMYSEPASTPARSASLTGQLPIRNGMYRVGFPVEYRGLSADNVTIAEVLSRAGYATGFFGKFHLGDLEVSYPHNQGFGESFFALYDQAVARWYDAGVVLNAAGDETLRRSGIVSAPLDNSFFGRGYVFYLEGQRGGDTREWCGTSSDCFITFDTEAQRRALSFVRRNARCGKPFYMAWWPLRSAVQGSVRLGKLTEKIVGQSGPDDVDQAVGLLLDTLRELGVDQNTLIIAMSANGPIVLENPSAVAQHEGPFRGGKGDVLEGGVRVSAQAWWPGAIAPGQVVNDLMHVTDLFTTFARVAGGYDYLPRDRVIDGVDQSALLLHGAGNSRRDYSFIYQGPELAAIVKQHYKSHWSSFDFEDGIARQSVFDLLHDHRETYPLTIGAFQLKDPFRRMRSRHEQWLKKYPPLAEAKGPAYTGLSNARPETVRIAQGASEFHGLPYDPMEHIQHGLPFDASAQRGIGEQTGNSIE